MQAARPSIRRHLHAGAGRLAPPIRRHLQWPDRGRRALSTAAATASLHGLLRVSDEVADAVKLNKPVVALESTIYTHGALGRDLAQQHQELVRSHGAIPAIVAVVDGVPTVGVSAHDITRMMEHEATVKASRRDIAYLAGMVSSLHPPSSFSYAVSCLFHCTCARLYGIGGSWENQEAR